MKPDFFEIYWTTVRHFEGSKPRYAIIKTILEVMRERD